MSKQWAGLLGFQGEPYLWIKVKSLQSVDDQGVLCQPVIHDHVEAVHEGGSFDNGLVVGIVKALEPRGEDKCAPLRHVRWNKLQMKERNKHSSQRRISEPLTQQMEPCTAHLFAHCRGDGGKKSVCIPLHHHLRCRLSRVCDAFLNIIFISHNFPQ